MPIIDTVRPVAACAGTSPNWFARPSGTLHGVTADDDDSTYAYGDAATLTGNLFVTAANHTVPANHERHRWRVRVRGMREAAGGTNVTVAPATGLCPPNTPSTSNVFIPEGTITTVAGSWTSSNGLTPDGTITPRIRLLYSSGVPIRIYELYLDIDSRHRPEFTPDVLDGAGVSRAGGTVTDTRTPTLVFGGVSYDGLPALDWQVEIAGLFSESGSGVPPDTLQTSPLPNGSYTAVFTVRSTVRGSDAFEHVETVNFDVDFQVATPPPPANVTAVHVDGAVLVSWENPGGQPWDNDFAVAEVVRTDCFGEHRIAVIPDALTGSYLDRTAPVRDALKLCGHDGACDITYHVRYWGTVSDTIVVPANIPDGFILAWPGSADTIPSGWTRVDSLNGRFPRGASGNTTGATGGTASHSHTTPSHTHSRGAHSHAVGGSTGTSNDNTIAARFSGASHAQADQPHRHSRPSSTGSFGSGNFGSSSPGTSTVNHLPPYLDVIWIESGNSQPAFPHGVLGFSVESIDGWSDYAAANGRFLRGATAGSGGGSTGGSSSHSHTVNSHTHSGASHTHSLGSTGLSVPVGINAGFGSTSPPQWLPRHTHPLTVGSASTGNTHATSPPTHSANHQPPNRRLRVLQNNVGGVQTRIIGLWKGDADSIPIELQRCDGTNGTPDMRGWFARERGTDSVGSTGGTSTHSHTSPPHTHGISPHTHTITVGQSTTTALDRPTFGDLANVPISTHTHSSSDTSPAAPSVGSTAIGTTNAVSHIPPYEEVHFVRLEALGSTPIDVPQTQVTEFSSVQIEAVELDSALDRIVAGDDTLLICTTRAYDLPRHVVRATRIEGGLPSVATSNAVTNITLVLEVRGRATLDNVETMLANTRLHYEPYGGRPGWFAPASWSVTRPAPRVYSITVTLTQTDPPPLPDPQELLVS